MRSAVGIPRWWSWLGAFLGPGLLTALLLLVNPGQPQYYVFLYLGIVALLGVGAGVAAAIIAAAASFLFVDFLFVAPVHTFTVARTTDLIDLSAFLGTAILVGTVGSRRRQAQLRAEALALELQEANVELARLAETEREMLTLKERDRIRRELLANVSHELRTPLAGILTGTTALLERTEAGSHLREDLGAIVSETHRLNRLVSDMLDMTRIEGGIIQLQLGDFDVDEAITAARDRLARRSPERSFEYRRNAGVPDVVADWDRLGQIIDNLIINADQASPPGTAIRVTVGTEGNQVVIRIIDGGPGVAAPFRDHIFERFVRATAPTAAASGTGLGLPIARGLAEALGGRLWLEDSGPGEGARFALSLPAAREAVELSDARA